LWRKRKGSVAWRRGEEMRRRTAAERRGSQAAEWSVTLRGKVDTSCAARVGVRAEVVRRRKCASGGGAKGGAKA